MKVLQIAPLISPRGEFGGPVTVAVNQSKALMDLGHDVTLMAGTRGYEKIPTELSGVPVRLFPCRVLLRDLGYATLTAPRSLPWLLHERGTFDAVHVHLARDLITLPIARLALALGMRVFIQPHGMIDPSNRRLARPIDLTLTIPVLRKAERVFYLTDLERQGLASVGGCGIKLEQLNNGVPRYRAKSFNLPDRRPEVVYVGRLHSRKRPLDFIRMALELSSVHRDVDFTLIGPDEGEGQAVRSMIDSAGNPPNVSWLGPLKPEDVIKRVSNASLYIQPSIDETFPMSVLEAMSTGTAIVLRESCGLASMIEQTDSGIVVGLGMPELISAVDVLLRNSQRLNSLGQHAQRAADTLFSMEAIARRLEGAYVS